jgi:hypothetical protein
VVTKTGIRLAPLAGVLEEKRLSDKIPASPVLAPVFATEEQAASFLNITAHQLYLLRKDGGGPPFTMFGARVRYPLADLEKFAASLPLFNSRAEAYAHDRKRSAAAANQRAALAGARKTRHHKTKEASAST